MKRSTRMLLMSSGRQGGGRSYDGRTEYDGERYGPDSRFRDRRGREHYDNGRFAPRGGDGMWVDGRYWDDREDYRPENHYPMTTPYVPPVYEEDRRYQETGRPRNRIGFVMRDDSTPEFGREYRTDAGRYKQEDELSYRPGGASMTGYGFGLETTPLTSETAMEWGKHMENADGSHGPHWTMEKTEEARKQRNIQCDPLEFYVAMNMMYSDYVKAAEKINCSSMDFYAYMAKAFLDDKDAQPDKLARYYRYVVAH